MRTQNKSQLRTELLQKRRSYSPEERRLGSKKALELLVNSNLITPTSVVAAYWPMADEFDVCPIINWLHANRIICVLPCMVTPYEPLVFRLFRKSDMLVNEPLFNISQPLEKAPLLKPTIIIVPIVGFDRRGYRLGMGGGFYDRTLAVNSCVNIGISFAGNEVPAIPNEPHDIRMHTILTEKELIQITP